MDAKLNLIKSTEKVEVPFKKIVMICSHCGDQFKSSEGMNKVERIKSELKSCVKEKLAQGEVRVVTSSCLSVCPENKIAVVIFDPHQANNLRGLAIDPEITKEQLFDQIFIHPL